MKLIVEPDDGVAPVLAAIKKAQKTIDVAIFRFDRSDVEGALKAAVARGVRVSALIADANRGGEKSLRRLELRFLEAGITVARTADDLVRYHDKFMVIDGRVLHVLSFNCTHLDIDRSRGFGIVTEDAQWVHEANRLFQADSTRTLYAPSMEAFVVSPLNSRKVLAGFLRGAKRELLIYDPKVSDDEMVRILEERAKAGVDIRIIGKLSARAKLAVHKLPFRLHTRTIIRDRHQAFNGSQSLRAAELDSRRELGLIVRDPNVIKKLVDIFESDWTASTPVKGQNKRKKNHVGKTEKRAETGIESEEAVKVLVQELNPLTATVKKAVRKVVATAGEEVLHDKTVKATVKKVVKKVVKKAVRDAVEEFAGDSHD